MQSERDSDELAAWRAARRRDMNRNIAWMRHRRAAAVQKATGSLSRGYNQLEAGLARLMDESGVDYQWQFRLGRYVFDFLLPDRVLIEVHGTYWHADPRFHARDRLTPLQKRNIEHDRKKADFAVQSGYRLKVVWEQDLKHGRISINDLVRRSLDGVVGKPRIDNT